MTSFALVLSISFSVQLGFTHRVSTDETVERNNDFESESAASLLADQFARDLDEVRAALHSESGANHSSCGTLRERVSKKVREAGPLITADVGVIVAYKLFHTVKKLAMYLRKAQKIECDLSASAEDLRGLVLSAVTKDSSCLDGARASLTNARARLSKNHSDPEDLVDAILKLTSETCKQKVSKKAKEAEDKNLAPDLLQEQTTYDEDVREIQKEMLLVPRPDGALVQLHASNHAMISIKKIWHVARVALIYIAIGVTALLTITSWMVWSSVCLLATAATFWTIPFEKCFTPGISLQLMLLEYLCHLIGRNCME